ncbi:SAM-dependent methyltransferase [Actinoplanes sp. TRM 88003]|uniref:SAM-dependent methyltransferase n=1 Tax=Paractinoplanes aksuensis TaxID=2939490 RepID=A0ABT1DZA2_9ACTN|nr:SAM-dependent methyltransferase [Actinoplanes aksuensis]MCO8276215.1 SAM-dependent methyltransferase [Actinoplanes aksuensis]
MPPEEQAHYQQLLGAGISDIWPRDRAAFAALFDGLELVEPGVELISRWRPGTQADRTDPSRISIWGAVARKP